MTTQCDGCEKHCEIDTKKTEKGYMPMLNGKPVETWVLIFGQKHLVVYNESNAFEAACDKARECKVEHLGNKYKTR